jgi:hypothetical protein
VLVSVDLDNGYDEEVRQVINGGVRTTFTYDVELKMIVPAWVDRTIATATVTITDRVRHADAHAPSFAHGRWPHGRREDDRGRDRCAEMADPISGLVLCRTSKLDPHREYYVRINAGVRPPRHTLGWANGVTNLAKFTFVP